MLPETIALFPLQTVLFPGGLLPLQIFEQRYLDMVSRCMRDEAGFGVCCLSFGNETANKSKFASIGTYAKIDNFDTLANGLLGIEALGIERFKILHHWQAENGLYLANIKPLSEPTELSLPEHSEWMKDLALALQIEMGEPYQRVSADNLNGNWVSARLAEWLPLPLDIRQSMLEMESISERLDELNEHIQVEVDGPSH